MGLDMYLKGRKMYSRWDDGCPKDDDIPVSEVTLGIGYWRKHPNLHGYIVKEFADSGEDNCEPIYLNEENLLKIIDAIEKEQLPHTEGFFFGQSDGSEKIEDLEIFKKAIEWLKLPKQKEFSKWVEYQASW